MSVPAKYRAIGDFHEYYSGTRLAPYLTLFVGGNHEASNHLWELYYGGWVAPKIYYLGAANVINFGPLRIAGLSGIWAGHDYNKPHFERLPYGPSEVKSIYHVRELDTRKLLQIRTQVDVGISHDWPREIEWKGDWKQLFRFKPHFQADARSGRLGNLAAKLIMDHLRPKWWFSAHLHCKFSAIVDHEKATDVDAKAITTPAEVPHQANGTVESADGIDVEIEVHRPPDEASGLLPEIHNNDEVDVDMDDETSGNSKPPVAGAPANAEQEAQPETNTVPTDLRAQLPAAFSRPVPAPTIQTPCPEGITNKTTHFLSLDKCLPRRQFLQVLEVDPISDSPPDTSKKPYCLTYDKEWLAITRTFASIGPLASPVPPNLGESHYRPLIEAEEAWIEENLVKQNKMDVPKNFEITAPVYDQSQGLHPKEHSREYTNPQTVAFCEMLGIHNFFDMSEEERKERRDKAPPVAIGEGRGDGGRGRGRDFGGRGRGRGRGYR